MTTRISDSLWESVAALLPPAPPKVKQGRTRIPDRAALTGIVHVLRTGIAWERLPLELGCGSGMTCWRRLREWQRAGAWQDIRSCLEPGLAEDGAQVDWSRAAENAPFAPRCPRSRAAAR